MPPESSRRIFVGRIRREADQLDLQLRQFVHQRLRQIEIFAHRHLDVLHHRQRGEQRALLEQHAETHVERIALGLVQPCRNRRRGS